jgi:Gpi18-like mannosyltransferase
VEFLFKLLPIVADMLTVWVLYLTIEQILRMKVESKAKREFLAVVGAGVYALAPFTTINAAVWGQMDALFTLFLILAFYFFARQNLYFAAICYAISLVIKPHGLFLAMPIIMFFVVQKKYLTLMSLLAYVSMALFVLAYPAYGFNSIGGMYGSINNNLEAYEYNSLNLYNFWGMFGFYLNSNVPIVGPLSINMIGYILTLVAYVLGLWSMYTLRKVFCTRHGLLVLAYYLAYFVFASIMFLPKMHERYYYPIFIFMFAHIYSLEVARERGTKIAKILSSLYVLLFGLILLHSLNLLFVYDIMMYTPLPSELFRVLEMSAPILSGLTYLLFLYYTLASEYIHRKWLNE